VSHQHGETDTVLIADKDPDIRLLMKLAVAIDADIEIVGEAADGAEAVELWREIDGPPAPDVVVLADDLPFRSGIVAGAEILAERPEQKIVLCSSSVSGQLRSDAAAVGIATCLSKQHLDCLPDVIDELHDSG